MHKNEHLSKFSTKYKAMQCWVACLSTWLWHFFFFYFWPSTVTRQANSTDNIATANVLWLHAVKKLQYCVFFVRNYYLYHTVLNLVFTWQQHKHKAHSVDAHSLWGTSLLNHCPQSPLVFRHTVAPKGLRIHWNSGHFYLN